MPRYVQCALHLLLQVGQVDVQQVVEVAHARGVLLGHFAVGLNIALRYDWRDVHSGQLVRGEVSVARRALPMVDCLDTMGIVAKKSVVHCLLVQRLALGVWGFLRCSVLS